MSSFGFLRRAIAPPIFRWLGIDIFGQLRWLSVAGDWPSDERQKWRLAKLNELLAHCWAHVPFYRDYWSSHGVRPGELRNLDDLAGYPTVPHDLFKERRDEMLPDNLDTIPHKTASTGGTTGSPLKYHQDLELHALRYAFQIVGRAFAGCRFGDEVFAVAGGSLVPSKVTFRNKARSRLTAARGLCCLQMDDELARACWRVMARQRTKLLVGYPSTLSLLCSSLAKQGLQIGGLKAVSTTAEMLLPQYRATIEDYTGVEVFDHYGCNDGGLLSYECEQHMGLHYNDLESVLEVMDPDNDGTGELAVTNLWNRSMPFVRYLNGDLLKLEEKRCQCGRRYPLIASVQGRTSDILSFSNGKNLTGPGVTLIFKDMEVEEWQVVQTGPSSLEARIRSKAPLSEGQTAHIYQLLHQHLGDECEISLRYMNKLSLTHGSKLKPVFSEWNPQ